MNDNISPEVVALNDAFALLTPLRQQLIDGPSLYWEKIHHAQLYISKRLQELLEEPRA